MHFVLMGAYQQLREGGGAVNQLFKLNNFIVVCSSSDVIALLKFYVVVFKMVANQAYFHLHTLSGNFRLGLQQVFIRCMFSRQGF